MSTPLVSYEIATDREDLSDVLGILEQYDTPLLDRIMAGGMACTNTTHEWINKPMPGHRGYLVTTIDSSTTSLTLSGESPLGMPVKYFIYHVFEIEDEQFQIVNNPVANGSNWDVTVTRSYAGTTAAAHDANDEVDIIGRPLPEGFIPSQSNHHFGSKANNITEIFGDYISMSRTARSIKVAGGDNKVSSQINDKLKELRKLVERAAIRGKKRVDGSGDNRKMDGLAGFLSGDSETVDAGNNAIDVDVLDQAIKQQLEIGAKPNMILCSYAQKFRFNDLKVERVKQAQPQSDKKLNNILDVYQSEAGDLEIIPSHDVKAKELFILDTSKMKVVPLQQSAFGLFEQGKRGSNEDAYVEGEYTMELYNPEAHRRITNLAV